MNLLRSIKITFIITLLSFTAVSCMKSNDANYPNHLASYATILLTEDNPTEIIPTESKYYLLADDSTLLHPTNFQFLDIKKLKNNQRCWVSFTKHVDETNTVYSSKEPLLIDLVDIGGVVYKDVLQTSKIDTLENSITNPLTIWYSGGVHGSDFFINIPFQYYPPTQGKIATVNLVENLKNTSSIKDGYYQLDFMVDSENSGYYDQVSSGLVSIAIDPKYLGEDIKGLRITFKDENGVLINDYPYPTK